MQRLAEAPTFTIHPWVTAPSELLPENPKDAYLIQAIELHSPTCLLTLDLNLLALGSRGGAQIMTPKVLLEELQAIDP